jgi:hypothetical protein
MGVVVKITAHSGAPSRWIGHNPDVGSRSIVCREEARVFDSAFDADREIEAFRDLIPTGAVFELEDE